LNIGLVIYGSLDILTGGFLYDRKLVEFLRATGDRVEVFAFPWRTYPSHLLQNVSLEITSWVRSLHLDVLLEDELNHPSLFLANKRLKSLISCPIIAIVHHLRCCEMRPRWQNRLYGAVERHFLQGVDGYIFPSFTTAAAVESLIAEKKPFVVAHPGKDAVTGGITREDVRRRSFADGPFNILFVGNLIPRKGLHVLIDGAALLPTRQWRLRVVGSPTADRQYAQYIRAKVKKYGLEKNIDLLGAVTGNELCELYRASHVLAAPSSYEGFGIVYVEGMAFGLPSIATTSGAAREIIKDGVNGFLVEPDDHRSVSRCLSTLIADREKLFSMACRAMERHGDYPTWRETAGKIRAFLQTITANATEM